MDKKKPKRSLFDNIIQWFAIAVLAYFAVNEFSHLYRTSESIVVHQDVYERHYNLTLNFPFVGSYFLMKPKDYDPKYKYPVVVVLQGISKRIYAAEYLAEENYRERYRAFVIVPVSPVRAFWEKPQNKEYSLPQMIPYPDHMPQVVGMIDDVRGQYTIDKDRIYITGHSMGGMGVIGALQRYPDLFAAGIALSVVWNPAETDKIKSPLWIIHGSKDGQIPVQYSRQVAQTLSGRGMDVKYDELAGIRHDTWKIIYPSGSVWDWLFKNVKPPGSIPR